MKILFVSNSGTGRGLAAAAMMREKLVKSGKSGQAEIDAASCRDTGDIYYDYRIRLKAMNLPFGSSHRFTRKDYDAYDYIYGMDEAVVDGIREILGGQDSGQKIRNLNIEDPWVVGDIDETISEISQALNQVLDETGLTR